MILDVVGSSPVIHPNKRSLAEMRGFFFSCKGEAPLDPTGNRPAIADCRLRFHLVCFIQGGDTPPCPPPWAIALRLPDADGCKNARRCLAFLTVFGEFGLAVEADLRYWGRVQAAAGIQQRASLQLYHFHPGRIVVLSLHIQDSS